MFRAPATPPLAAARRKTGHTRCCDLETKEIQAPLRRLSEPVMSREGLTTLSDQAEQPVKRERDPHILEGHHARDLPRRHARFARNGLAGGHAVPVGDHRHPWGGGRGATADRPGGAEWSGSVRHRDCRAAPRRAARTAAPQAGRRHIATGADNADDVQPVAGSLSDGEAWRAPAVRRADRRMATARCRAPGRCSRIP